MNGQLTLVCAHRYGRSRLTTVRFDGLARASAPLPDSGDAVRVVTSTLGPGFLDGDRLAREVDVAAGATLVVVAQMASPVFARERPSQNEARSRVAAGAALYAPGETLLLAPHSRHESTAEVDVWGDGVALLAEIVVLGTGARLRSRTTARIDGRLVARDACDFEGDGNARAFLSAMIVSSDAKRRATIEAALVSTLDDDPTIRGGVGPTPGATLARAIAPGAWTLQQTLDRIVVIARDAFEKRYACLIA